MSPVAECLAWAGGTWMAIAIAAAWVKHRLRRQPPYPQRTPADVHADAAEHRAERIADVNRRLRRAPRPVRLDDIAHLDEQLADLDHYAQTIQPLYVGEEQE